MLIPLLWQSSILCCHSCTDTLVLISVIVVVSSFMGFSFATVLCLLCRVFVLCYLTLFTRFEFLFFWSTVFIYSTEFLYSFDFEFILPCLDCRKHSWVIWWLQKYIKVHDGHGLYYKKMAKYLVFSLFICYNVY